MLDKFWRDVIALRRHQMERHFMKTFEGIRISVQYQVSVTIASDIYTLALRKNTHKNEKSRGVRFLGHTCQSLFCPTLCDILSLHRKVLSILRLRIWLAGQSFIGRLVKVWTV